MYPHVIRAGDHEKAHNIPLAQLYLQLLESIVKQCSER
jgi:hypothetical protein